MPKRLKDMSGVKNAQALSGLSEPLRTLINAIYAGTEEISVWGAAKQVKYFLNHVYDKDPETKGALPGGVTVLIYYQPATQAEYDSWEVIDKHATGGFLSGRRRLAVRIEAGRHPAYIDTFSFYMTNHPKQQPGLRTNEYGAFTPINTAQ
jgi:hypothetical protein